MPGRGVRGSRGSVPSEGPWQRAQCRRGVGDRNRSKGEPPMRFWLKFVSIASIAGVFAWAASAAPLQTAGNGANVGYGYGAAKVTICHIPPGNPNNAHTITVGASAVPAHLAHGDTLGPCPEVAAAAQNAGTQQKTNKG